MNFIHKYFHIRLGDEQAYQLAKKLIRFRLKLKLLRLRGELE